ncbi:hypothetical protein AB0J43_60370, partial [Nonomuraea fuscirosea]
RELVALEEAFTAMVSEGVQIKPPDRPGLPAGPPGRPLDTGHGLIGHRGVWPGRPELRGHA